MASKLTQIEKEVKQLQINEGKNTERLEHMAVDVQDIKHKVNNLDEFANSVKETVLKQVGEEYTTLDKFEPVKLIAYGAVGAILLIVIGAIMGVVLVPHIPL